MSDLMPKQRVVIQNDSGMDIPPNSVVQITSVEQIQESSCTDAIAIYHVNQYAGGQGVILVTGYTTIPASATTGNQGEWNQACSYAEAFSDDLVFVAFDQGVSPPVAGETWGPESGAWTITRGGTGFDCLGFDQTSGLTIAAFRREEKSQPSFYFGMITSPVYPGTLAAPTLLTFDAWIPNPIYGSGSSSSVGSGSPQVILPVGYVRATDSSLLGMNVANVGCWSVQASGSMGSSSGSGSSGSSILIPGRIEYDSLAGQWVLVWVGRCTPMATSVSCGSGGLNVVYGNIPG